MKSREVGDYKRSMFGDYMWLLVKTDNDQIVAVTRDQTRQSVQPRRQERGLISLSVEMIEQAESDKLR